MNYAVDTLTDRSSPPTLLRPWLEASGSLTKMAKARCASVHVKLLQTGWAPDACYHREILMLCDESPWWYAHTRIPASTFDKRADVFQDLGERSLGCLLFSDPHITRQSLRFFEVSFASSLYQQAACFVTLDHDRLWARESVYHVEGQPLYLLELFLPAMLKTLC